MKTVLSTIVAVGLTIACSCVANAQLEPGEPATTFDLNADWVTGVEEATDIAFMADGRAVITMKAGAVAVTDKDGKILKNPAATFAVDAGSEKGLLGVVRDDRGTLYFYASTGDTANKHKVYKATLAADGTVTVDMANPIVDRGLEGPANHDGGGLIIHKGQLYISTGDTGANSRIPTNKYASCLNKPNGKILRVNLDGSVPDDNPLANVATATSCTATRMGVYELAPPDKRIWAWGFRNAWRFWIDPKTDLMWIGDVGEQMQEEITVGGKGTHHGYPFVEGSIMHGAVGGVSGCNAMTPATECTPPVHSYGRGDGASVTGGLMPVAGCGWGAYEQRYIFGDYDSGRVWTLDVNAQRNGVVANSRKVFGMMPGVVSFRMGPGGSMYIVSHANNRVSKLTPKMVPASCDASPPPGTGGAGGMGVSGAGGTGGGAGTGGAGGTAGAGGGTGGMAGAGTGGTGMAGAGTGGSGMAGAPGNGDPGGCSCSLSGSRSGGLALGLLVVVAGALARRRRRR
jgi:MYXO-CTERM domain-containing protein